MSESSIHIELVDELAGWIAKSFCNGDHGYIFIERPDNPAGKRPQQVSGSVPDVMVINAPGYKCVIGEAKTANDIDNQHTIDQIRVFLRKCAEFEGSFFVFAVPWYRVGLARSIIKYCCRDTGIDDINIIVLDKLPG